MTHGGLILHVEKNASERGLFFVCRVVVVVV